MPATARCGLGDGQGQEVVTGLVRHRRTPPRTARRNRYGRRGPRLGAARHPSKPIRGAPWRHRSPTDPRPCRCTGPTPRARTPQGDPARAGRLPHRGHGRTGQRRRGLDRGRPRSSTSTAPATCSAATSTGREVAELLGAQRVADERDPAAARADRAAGDHRRRHRRPGRPGASRPRARRRQGHARPHPVRHPRRGRRLVCPATEPEEPGTDPAPYPRDHQRRRRRHRGVRLRGGHRLVAARGDRPGVAVAGRRRRRPRDHRPRSTSTRTPGTGPSSPASSAPRPRPREIRVEGFLPTRRRRLRVRDRGPARRGAGPGPGHHLAVAPAARRATSCRC